MTNELKERGKKGQHIFEHVNLSNVFWVCPKKKKSHFKMPFVANSMEFQFLSVRSKEIIKVHRAYSALLLSL